MLLKQRKDFYEIAIKNFLLEASHSAFHIFHFRKISNTNMTALRNSELGMTQEHEYNPKIVCGSLEDA